MKDLIEQLASLVVAGIAAACCLGIPIVLSAVGAVGLGFLIYDAYLLPIFAGFIGLSLWLLYRSARRHGNSAPFWLSLAGALVGTLGLWLMVTGVYPLPWSVYLGLAVFLAGSVWDFSSGLWARAADAAPPLSALAETDKVDTSKRIATGAALSAAAAVSFYGMYKSVAVFAPEAQADEIACWGINECKGQSACTTAFNACTGQNECQGQGFINVPEKECYARGGEPLTGSEADPAKA